MILSYSEMADDQLFFISPGTAGDQLWSILNDLVIFPLLLQARTTLISIRSRRLRRNDFPPLFGEIQRRQTLAVRHGTDDVALAVDQRAVTIEHGEFGGLRGHGLFYRFSCRWLQGGLDGGDG